MNRYGFSIVPPSARQLEKAETFKSRIEQARALRAQEAEAPVNDQSSGTPAQTTASPKFTEPKPFEPTAILSPSSVNQFAHDCQVKWFYKRVLGLPDTRSAALGLGSAVHEAIGANFRQKLDTREDLPTEGVIAVFRDALAKQLDQITLDKTESAADLHACGEVMTKVYMQECAPRIQPAAVERAVSGRIGDVPVQGFIDVLDTAGNIVDLKTAAKKPSGVNAGYRVQVSTYAMLEPTASGRARLDTLTKAKTVGLHQQTLEVTDADRKQATRLYSIAREQMQSGLFLPNRSSHLCSRKYCAFWSRCQDEYGGEVS